MSRKGRSEQRTAARSTNAAARSPTNSQTRRNVFPGLASGFRSIASPFGTQKRARAAPRPNRVSSRAGHSTQCCQINLSWPVTCSGWFVLVFSCLRPFFLSPGDTSRCCFYPGCDGFEPLVVQLEQQAHQPIDPLLTPAPPEALIEAFGAIALPHLSH